MTSERTHLIVTGVGRSGTTALAKLLNAHPRACIGIERFKFRFLRANDYDAGLFGKARFFDFREGDTNLRPEVRPAWRATYDEMARKWDHARVVGDKVPDMEPVLRDFLEANPGFRAIAILRNLADVGLSWQARATNRSDAWPSSRGFVAACRAWPAQMAQLHALMQDRTLRDRILVLDYDRMYADPPATGRLLLSFLDLPPSPVFAAQLSRDAAFAAGRPPRHVPRRFREAYGAADRDAWRRLRKVAAHQAAPGGGVPVGPASVPGAAE